MDPQEGCTKLVRSLLDEYRRRSPYIAYLVRSRQGLLSSLAHMEKVTARLETEQRMSSKFLITVCVRLFLERREEELQLLELQFRTTNVMDEKTELVVQFLSRVWAALELEPMLAAAGEEQRDEARKAVERAVFSQIYMAALYPNQEADVSRDLVLQRHLERLAAVVTPGHRDLKIPRRYQYECPWPAAQVGSSPPHRSVPGGAAPAGGVQAAGGQGALRVEGLRHHHEPAQPLPGQGRARRRRLRASSRICEWLVVWCWCGG